MQAIRESELPDEFAEQLRNGGMPGSPLEYKTVPENGEPVVWGGLTDPFDVPPAPGLHLWTSHHYPVPLPPGHPFTAYSQES